MASKLKEAGLSEAPVPTRTNNADVGEPESGLLKLLESAFLAPVLSLVQVYLSRSNGNKRTIENSTLEFRNRHPKSWKFFFFMDFCFRFVYMVIVFIIVIRGLGIDEYLMELFGQ